MVCVLIVEGMPRKRKSNVSGRQDAKRMKRNRATETITEKINRLSAMATNSKVRLINKKISCALIVTSKHVGCVAELWPRLFHTCKENVMPH